MSWGFIGLAIGALTAYLVVMGSRFVIVLKEVSEEEKDVSEGGTT